MDLCYETAHSLANKLLTCWPSFKASSTRPSIFFLYSGKASKTFTNQRSATFNLDNMRNILFFFEQLAVTKGLPTGLRAYVTKGLM